MCVCVCAHAPAADPGALLGGPHARQPGLRLRFPNFADPIFVSKLVVEDADRSVVMASLARLTCEMYLLVDREKEGNCNLDKSGARANDMRASSPCIALPNTIFSHAVSMTRMPGCRPRSHAALDDASNRSAGFATMHGAPYCRRLREP